MSILASRTAPGPVTVVVEDPALRRALARRREDWLHATAGIATELLEESPASLAPPACLVADRAREVVGAEVAVVLRATDGGDPVLEVGCADRDGWQAGQRVPVPVEVARALTGGHAPVVLPIGAWEPGSVVGDSLVVPLAADEQSHGVLVLSGPRIPEFDAVDLGMSRAFARQASLVLGFRATQLARAQLAVTEDRERIARNLHDLVIGRLFAAGMTLQGLTSHHERTDTFERMTSLTTELDTAILDIRRVIFELRVD
jgi:two-component system sensor histidine kinase DevS